MLTADESTQFARLVPAVSRGIKYKLKSMKVLCADDQNEAVADCLALAMTEFARATRNGHDCTATSIVRYAMRQYRAGRRVGQASRRPEITARMPKQRALFFDDVAGDSRGNPADIAAFAIDYAEWHSHLIGAPLQVCDLLGDGYRPSDVADLVALSRGRVSQMRGELALSWDDFQGGAGQ
jgi:hypothetical protein